MFEMYVDSDGKKLRCGYTTGSCSAGAAKAASMILFGKADTLNEIEITSPKGIKINMPINSVIKAEDYVECSIIKFSGDDPDITNGIEINARVRRVGKNEDIIHTLADYDDIENGEMIYLKGDRKSVV